MPILPALIALLGALYGAGPAVAAITDYPFRVVTRGADANYQIVAENSGPAPITVHVDVTGLGIASDRKWPMTVVVSPYTVLPLARVVASEGSSATYKARFSYSYHFGRIDAVQDADVAYRLPFEHRHGFEVSQAYGGALTSHDNATAQFAIDFAMPSGSAVVAAREGVVIDVTLRYKEGGFELRFLDKANTVGVAHDDGTVAEYAHLSPGPAMVALGERVGAGALLGYSGSTGYSSEPHLHFIVTRPVVSEGRVIRRSVPVQFYTDDSKVRFSAQMGVTVWANYASEIRMAAVGPRRVP